MTLRALLVLALALGTLATAAPARAVPPPLEAAPEDDPKCPPLLPPEICDLLRPILERTGTPYVKTTYRGTTFLHCAYDSLTNRSILTELDEYEIEVGLERKGVETPLVWFPLFVPRVTIIPGNIC